MNKCELTFFAPCVGRFFCSSNNLAALAAFSCAFFSAFCCLFSSLKRKVNNYNAHTIISIYYDKEICKRGEVKK